MTLIEQTLGRPWNDLATTVFLSTYMDESINPEGWKPFGGDRCVSLFQAHLSSTALYRPTIANTTYYAEYNSTGT